APFVEVTQKVLPRLERVAVEEAGPDQENIGPGAAGEASGLGVQIQKTAPRGRRGPGAREEAHALGNERSGRAERRGTVTMSGIEPLPHDEDAAALRLLHVATEDVFEAGPARRGRWHHG